MELETKLAELTGKIKALNFTLGKCDDAITARNREALTRHEASITKRVVSVHTLKEEIEELKFVKDETEDAVRQWAEDVEAKMTEADAKAVAIRHLLTKMEEEAKAVQRAEVEQAKDTAENMEKEKQLALEKAKYELEQAHKEEERKRELKHQNELLNQKLQYEKSVGAVQETKQKKVTNTNLPKLTITKFSGDYSDWLPFWNAFEAEIESSDLAPVTKFGYLKEWLEPKVRAEVDGLPFTTEGYQRAKSILRSEYGKTSEIINAHIQSIMALPVINGSHPAKVHDFYKTLLFNVQSLETLGKLEQVNGTARSVLEKLKGIKADLVRGEDGWQSWDFSRLIVALKKWKDINPVEDGESPRKPPSSKSFGKTKPFYHTKESERHKRACVYCEEADHISKDCSRVTTLDERKKLLAQKRLCFNCTGSKHRASECKSNTNCQKCNLKHHTSICNKEGHNFLGTAAGTGEGPLVYPVVVVDVEGLKCRALLDTGAGSSYASAALLNRLPKRNHRNEVRRVEMMLGSVTKEMEMSTVKVEALDGKFQINVNVTKVDKGELLMLDNPNYQQLINNYQHLKGIQMEDNDHKRKLPVHLILGASDYMRIKTGERPRVGKTGEPVAEKTKFGWTIIAQGKEIDYTALLMAQTSQTDYEELCRLDILGLADSPEHDQREVYTEFREQLVRSEHGWYETGLPWKGNHPPLPTNRNGSLRRLGNLQRKLQKTGLIESYAQIIEKQKAEGIVEIADQQPRGVEFYIPHKPVVREAAESTKVRIVYDASARSHPDAPSLNQCLNTGPPLQNRLWNVLVRIQSNPNVQWRHVPTQENPADLGSRGGEVKDNKLWWDGPEWLAEQENWPPVLATKASKESDAEAKIIRELFASTVEIPDSFDNILAKFGLSKAFRVCAWVMRYGFNSRYPNQRVKGPLTTEEIEQQRLFWIKRAQENCDIEEDRLRLNLQVNQQDVLECRGRIQGQYPVYLPDTHPYTAKLVEDAHRRTLHGGVGMTMARVREIYWVPRLRQLTRKVVKRCFGCRRFQAKAVAQPPPGLLPLDRTEGSRPFQVVGVDFAGPIKYLKKPKQEAKSYIVLYACSLTRAVYLELLHSLNTQEFLQSFKRLIARRGRPNKVYSDNGKTFVAAAKWVKTAQSDEKFNEFLAANSIRWQFNLSRAPWWGGQFERLIGLVKRALYKTIGNGYLKWSELEEIILDIEMALNGRPLSYLENDVQMPTLTPNSMLFVGSTYAPELQAHHHEEVDVRKRARHLQKCKDAMWRRWSNEYVSGLRERHNLKHEKKSFTVAKGDVVIIRSDERNRGKWPLGVIEELYPGRDGVVRAVKVRAGKTFLERAVNHLYPLELSCDKSESKPESELLNPDATSFRPARDAAIAARHRIQNVAELEL